MAKEVRKVYDYFYQQQWVLRLGYVQHLKAHAPLPLHKHTGMTEFVYLERGTQLYQASGKEYSVKQDEVFFTLPDELHDTGSGPEERSNLYYLIIDLSLIAQLGLFTNPDTYEELGQRFARSNDRIFPASTELPDAMKTLLKRFSKKENDMYFDTHIRNALSEVLIALLMPYHPKENDLSFDITCSLRYIQEHLDEQIHISELATLEHTSLSTYHKYFVKATGIPPGEYILRQKTEKAKELLCSTDLSITEIAGKYGFSSGQYFATVFKRFFGDSPMQYRKKYR